MAVSSRAVHQSLQLIIAKKVCQLSDAVLIERSHGGEIATVTLNRPRRLNSMNLDLVSGLQEHLDRIAADHECRVVILTGAGRGFCSGADLDGEGEQPGSVAHSSPQAGMRIQNSYARLVTTMRSMPQVVIAAVNGPAVGGGFALALGADIRVASETARFAVAMVRIGLSGADMGISYLLPRYVGASRAMELMLTGRMVDVVEADKIGLLSAVVPGGQALNSALELAERILDNSPFGVWMTKEVARSALECGSLQAAVDIENRTQILGVATKDSVEAVAAYFSEHRKPRWTNE